MEEKYIQPVIAATQKIFKQIMSLSVEPVEILCREEAGKFYEVSGIIDFTNGLKGSLIVSFPRETASKIIQKLLRAKSSDSIDHNLLVDGIGEITNLICGNSKSALGKLGWQIQLSIPHVVMGEHYSIQRPKGVVSVGSVLETELGRFIIDLSVKRG